MRLFILLCFPLITSAQRNYSGFIVDKITGQRISYATVGLIKQNIGVSADEQGAFSIHSSFDKEDSLRISSVGYKQAVLPVSEWVNGKIVALQQKLSVLGEVVISADRQKQAFTLNRFGHCSWHTYSIGLETIYQLAQRFEAPEEGMQLTELELCKDRSESVFRLRIYDVDSLSQGPSIDLVDSLIEIRSGEKHVKVNLEKYNIVIPRKRFFVAIEWLFIPFNEQLETDKIEGKKRYYTLYKPALRFVKNRNAIQGNVWQLHFNGKWSEIYASSQDHNFQITAKLR